MLSAADWQALLLSGKLAVVTTTILCLMGVPLAWFIARSQSVFIRIIEVIVAMPLVLPPTVLGFYVLLILSAESDNTINLAFSFTGLVIGSVVYSLPFVVQPITQAFVRVPNAHFEAAASLGAGSVRQFFSIALPQARHGIIRGAMLGFAHTLGEFGVVLMIGGNIPGQTRVAAIAIYEHVEVLDYQSANALSLWMVMISAILLFGVYTRNRTFLH